MAIFSLLAKLGLDATSFQAGIKRSESAVTSFGRNAVGSIKGQLAAAFSVGAVSAFAHSVVEAADRIGDLSDQMDLSVEEVQKLDIAASRSGIKVEQLGQAFLKVGEYRKKAGEGDVAAVAQLQRMGLTLADIQNRSLSNKDITQRIFEWYLKTNRTAKDQADVVEVVGLKAQKLVAAFKALQDLGPVKLFSQQDIDALSQFNDSMAQMKRNMQVAAAGPMLRLAGATNVGMEAHDKVSGLADKVAKADPVLGALLKLAAVPAGTWAAQTALGESALKAIFGIKGVRGIKDKTAVAAVAGEPNGPMFTPIMSKGESSLTGGSLRSIGGFFYDRFDEAQPIRQIVTYTEKTANATKQMADDIRSVRVSQ